MADSAFLESLPKPAQNPHLFGHQAQQCFLQSRQINGRLHHALLLEGEKGIGKAGFAFHFAYHLLAGKENGTDTKAADAVWQKPVKDSALWQKMGQGAHPGLLYISRGIEPKTQKMRAAVGVEDIRRISRFLQQTAADKNWRIVIIDPADDMNRNAANALLKTLEEPPAKTLFILISHNPGRLLPTIRSRCQALRLKPLAETEMRAALGVLAGGNFDPDATNGRELIALAEGSPRRALTLLASAGVSHAKTLEALLNARIFAAPQAQKLAEDLAKPDNAEAYALFLNYVTEFLHKRAALAARQNRLPQAAAYAAFYAEQMEAIRQTAAFNLDKKQFILVLLQKLHGFAAAQAARS